MSRQAAFRVQRKCIFKISDGIDGISCLQFRKTAVEKIIRFIRIDADAGTLEVLVDAKEFAARPLAIADLSKNNWGTGRELFATFRKLAGPADQGASIFEVA